MSDTQKIRKNLMPFLEDQRITPSLVGGMAGDRTMSPDERALIDQLMEELGSRIYVNIMFQLTHEVFPEKEAKNLWGEILSHKFEMGYKLDRNVGVAVAAMDYLCNIRSRIESPSIISKDGMANIVEVAIRDGLTGLYEKFTFLQKLREELLRCERHGGQCSVLMMDLDNFKKFNDTYGHVKGDELLHSVGMIIQSCIRDIDIAGRYGGEEFSALLPYTSSEMAKEAAERIRSSVETLGDVAKAKVTMSIGISSFPSHASEPERLLILADKALYKSKANGKNMITLASLKKSTRVKTLNGKKLSWFSNFIRKFL